MKGVVIYTYDACQTCKKAIQFLRKHAIPFESRSIVDNPPKKAELRRMLKHLDGQLKKLFNTSGQVYREMNLTAKLPGMSEDEALSLLAENGKLIKRPFLQIGQDQGTVGFREDVWKNLLL